MSKATVTEQKEFVHLVLERETLKLENCSREILAILPMKGAVQEKGEAIAQKPKLPNGVYVTDHTGHKSQDAFGQEFGVMLGAEWSEVR